MGVLCGEIVLFSKVTVCGGPMWRDCPLLKGNSVWGSYVESLSSSQR